MIFSNLITCTTWPVILGIISIGWLSLVVGAITYFLGYRDGLAKGREMPEKAEPAERREPTL